MASIMITLKCITNLHVGSGDVNYNLVDNEVEKDPVTNYPVINSSGIKGALRKYFKRQNHSMLISWFGQEHDEKENVQQGGLSFNDARLLAIPMRASKGSSTFYLATTVDMIKDYNNLTKCFASGNKEINKTTAPVGEVEFEGYITPISIYEGDMYEITPSDIRTYSLPVISRNQLDNGVSENLWYEEFVPHESVFYFNVTAYDENLLNQFKDEINGKVIQFGGHESIGYGFCKVNVEV